VTERAHEIALTPEEVREILAHCGPHALLVGGQALALWVSVFEVTPPTLLAASISSDADFIGSADLARKLGNALKNWKFWRPELGDATPQTAKLTRAVDGGIKQIDFLGSIAGLDTTAVQRRAVIISLASGAELRVLHPLDVLESRLQNLLLIPRKRDAAGIAQAHLAVKVARAFLSHMIDEGENLRTVLDAIERIGQMAVNKRLIGVMLDYEIDVLSGVPVEKIEHPDFRTKCWPQIVNAVRERQNRQRARRARPRR
jgi:hypothetical protein